MKWYNCKEKLPPTHHRVLVCRELRNIDGLDHPVQVHDIGYLEGDQPNDRWRLESQSYCIFPCEPTISSGIISHWANLPKLPEINIEV